MSSIYIHIPFCQSRCIYCDFFSTTHLSKHAEYMEALVREMRERQDELPSHARVYHTLYIGGGTPSTLPAPLLRHLLEEAIALYPLTPGAEITVEANPDDITPEWVDMLKDTPVNRISMGVQTFDNNLLHFLHRRHDASQVSQAVHLLHDADYTNISIDLIYGIPGQDQKVWENDIAQALALDVPHLSAYSLMYEEGTALTRLRDRGQIEEVSEEHSLWCFDHLCNTLLDAGYIRYEISNFARPGFESRHNSSYWKGIPYLGFGAGAHSYDGNSVRRWNASSLQQYMSDRNSFETETLTTDDRYNELVMTRLRTHDGLNLDMLASIFGSTAKEYCLQQALPHLQRGNLQQKGQNISLTRAGIFISNTVMSDLFK